ncbi:MAG: N-6 DNA methylase [Chloroflexota bacterium]|nr:N-6 DNA methylase [Chloroflexota bacterium]
MLDVDTKRRIDTARDILVGKVPDPKSQVEQITIALIYKFMDDLDAESEEFGGERKFFAGDFARYGWAKLMHPSLGGYETLNLYAEAITRMPENPGIPPLFRDIFNNAYLPYRDPETLRAFLKVIDEFTYDHSERLGDAFEYLLSVLGAQGDAGQFRTPRHIIDFIVSVVGPKKDEVVLDPACGTAGFLISAYKHLLASNTDGDGRSALTPDDRGRLVNNFKGYDISPDMVRLSLANMYLHGFREPHIYEYDTLTSEERWNEYADVILANPPFMSPRGGIRPHNRFSVQSKRSEVLFVDYIAEHLTPNGRAGVIVPEGIVFQSQTAYRQLRKMLVEDYLLAVVSLPAGVFNPYSGVKTSILFLDSALAKRTNYVAFFKVENDGFDLGAQRRPIDWNDLPGVHAELGEYVRRLQENRSLEDFRPMFGLVVEREKIAEDGEYNLGGDRYREQARPDSMFPFVELKAIAKVVSGNPAPQGEKYFSDGQFPFVRTSDVGVAHRSDRFVGSADMVNQMAVDELRLRQFPAGTILFPKSGASTFLNHRVLMGEPAYVASHLAGIICDEKKASSKFVYHLLCQVDARSIAPDQAYPSLRLTEIENIRIPLPSLAVQQEIVAGIESYQRVLDGARAIVENYHPRISVDPEWPVAGVADLVAKAPYSFKAGPFGSALKKECYVPTGYKVYGQEQVIRGDANFGDYYIDDEKYRELENCSVQAGDVLVSLVGTYGKTLIIPDEYEPGIINPRLVKITLDREKMVPEFLSCLLVQDFAVSQMHAVSHGGTMNILSMQALKRLRLPVPPVETQRMIVAEIEAEKALVSASRELTERMEQRIHDAIGQAWGKEGAALAEG